MRSAEISQKSSLSSCYGERVSVAIQGEGGAKCLLVQSALLISILATLVYDVHTFVAERSQYRIQESSALTLVVSQLVYAWSACRKPNNYNARISPLTIEWE